MLEMRHHSLHAAHSRKSSLNDGKVSSPLETRSLSILLTGFTVDMVDKGLCEAARI